jgi:hypothetical protein
MEKKVGITCDNYKVEKFKAELEKAGFNDFNVVPDKNIGLTAIIVKCDEKDFFTIGVLCQDVEEHFRAMKN